MFSRDVTAAMLVVLNEGMAAMLLSSSNPPEIELHSFANVFFCFGRKTGLASRNIVPPKRSIQRCVGSCLGTYYFVGKSKYRIQVPLNNSQSVIIVAW